MDIRYEKIHVDPYGNCLVMTNGYLEVVVSLDIGPRIISFRRLSGENILFQDTKDLVRVDNADYKSVYGNESIWHAYAGHRIWMSPETYLSYYPDNEEITWDVKNNIFRFIQAKQKVTNIQIILEITFGDMNLVKINNQIINHGNKEKSLSVWALTMLKGPGIEIVPLAKDNTDFAPQRYYSLWNFGAKNNDRRACYGDKYFTLKMEPREKTAYKVGMNISGGVALYLVEGNLFVKRFGYEKDLHYPDNNVNYETYTNNLFLEMESLTPIKKVFIGKSVSNIEYWSLHEYEVGTTNYLNETELDKIILKYLNNM